MPRKKVVRPLAQHRARISRPVDRLRILTPTIPDPENFPEEWYSLATPDNFWMQWRLKAFLRLLQNLQAPLHQPLHGLEVGCGNGVLRLQIERATAWAIDGAEIDRKALEMSPHLRGDSLLYDVSTHNSELRERYDFLILFDVIEHIADVPSMLKDCLFHLKPGGWIYINVPALESLRSQYDEVAGHLRRYDRRSLSKTLQGLDIRSLQYWGMSMLPLLAMRKVMLMATPREKVIQRGFSPPGRLADWLLKVMLRTETRLLASPPLGTSLMAAARKPLRAD